MAKRSPKAPKVRKSKQARLPQADAYEHKQEEALIRPDIGLQSQFKQRKPPATYRYDKSLDPQMSWDINTDREYAESLIDKIRKAKSIEEAQAYAEQLKNMSSPFLNWSGKAERSEFTVPTLPLFVHERISTEAILKGLETHRVQPDLFADTKLDVTDRILKAYQHKGPWANRLILGDSLMVMNSLLRYEALGGQVQMIYIDPPYGVKFGSNFQPFIRKRDVKHNQDDDFTREPEMVQAYRDTWELGLHSYLTYMRDRFLLAKELLHPSGSIFVQISDENVHHVREILDEIFGLENFVSIIPFRKKTMPLGAKHLESVTDYLLWYAKDKERLKSHDLFEQMSVEGDAHWNCVELSDGTRRKMTREEINNHKLLPTGSTPFQLVSLYPAGMNQTGLFPFVFQGKKYRPPEGNSWFTNEEGMKRLSAMARLEPYEDGETLRYVLKLSDSPVTAITNLWSDTSAPSDKIYAVQTSSKVLQRCILMTTDPGDLVVDPTCGSGTTAYVAEQWGRRWITCDTSRVPIALARQRLLTATFKYYELANLSLSISGGFKYDRKQNKKGEEVGGIIPYISKGSIAQNEKAEEEVLVDRPNEVSGVVRVSGPFTVEATIPTPINGDVEKASEGSEGKRVEPSEGSKSNDHVTRLFEVLRHSPVIHLPGNLKVEFRNVRKPARSLELHAEAELVRTSLYDLADQALRDSKLDLRESDPIAFVFGPENGAVSERLVFNAAKEANARNYKRLFVIGFAFQDAATKLIQNGEEALGIPITEVKATMDLAMADLLKTTRSSQVFSVTGYPEVRFVKLQKRNGNGDHLYQLEVLGVDVYDPVTMETDHKSGNDVPAWFLDTNYNDLSFFITQAFFPRTSAWDNLQKSLRGVFSDRVWDHLASNKSEPFVPGENKKISIKVIDDRGNELMVVKTVEEAEEEK